MSKSSQHAVWESSPLISFHCRAYFRSVFLRGSPKMPLTHTGTLGCVSELDSGLLRYVLDIAREFEFSQVLVKKGDCRFEATLGETAPYEEPEPEEFSQESPDDPKQGQEYTVKSQFVGYFQKAPDVGQAVQDGQKVGVVRSLGLTNDVVAEHGGTIEEWFVDDGAPVEYAQPIVKVKTE